MPKLPFLVLALALGLAACVPAAEAPAPPPPPAPTGTRVGGALMDPARPIIDNLAQSNEHRTLVRIANAAGLAGTLRSGPFTLFAPTDAAFDRLPASTVETLLQPANRARLAGLLGYHLVPGRKTRADIAADVRAGRGTAAYRTQSGGTIRVRLEGDRIAVQDAHGGRSAVTQADVLQSNGVVHVVDTVFIPPL